jgi:hypothetical protein
VSTHQLRFVGLEALGLQRRLIQQIEKASVRFPRCRIEDAIRGEARNKKFGTREAREARNDNLGILCYRDSVRLCKRIWDTQHSDATHVEGLVKRRTISIDTGYKGIGIVVAGNEQFPVGLETGR